jgi:hypothetical protein
MPEADAIRNAAYAACGIANEGVEEVPDGAGAWGPAVTNTALRAESSAVAAMLSAEVAESLEQARGAVLEAARQTLAAYRRQQEARTLANSAENEWMVACFSSGTTREQTRAANRTRRMALRSHEEAWHAYQALAQQLCEAVEWMVALEGVA